MNLLDYMYFTKTNNTELSKRLGIARSYLYRLAHNRNRPSKQLAIRIEKETQGLVKKEELRPDLFK